MIDIVESLKDALRKGYELGGGELCLIASRHMEAYIAEVERLTAALQQIADDGKNCQDYCRSRARRALEHKP